MDEYPIGNPVIVEYAKLSNPDEDLSKEIEEAYGYDGLGLMVVKGVPNFTKIRNDLLPLSSKFAGLPDDVKEKYVHEKSHYSFGWSKGKESMKKGVFDHYKGSYYNNPSYDVPTEDATLIEKWPEVCSPNIWPTDDIPEFEPAFKAVGRCIVDVGKLIAAHCDKYVSSKLGDKYPAGQFEKVIETTHTTKARLLHYYEIPDNGERALDSWCGWHNDHSALTGLCPALFRDVTSNTAIANPDPHAGLHAKSRDGKIVRVKIPADCLAFQIGECTQVFTGATLRATPHAVKACKYPESKTTCRDTFAVFMQPNFDFILQPPTGVKVEDCAVGQYKEGMNFGAFGKATIDYYYGGEGGVY